ncbi:larval cuticle protein 65Ag1-like [Sitodiplosis mosellana]|uniref:larval cuticle protein 65Ag1-like n=1 Tax=Sitodiplosis mosellana TaxID=263140 RepID=UPI0024452996|nr:larval cuticle protein 65Ag1-like [Sitodiplosis mosellana]
MNKIAIAFFALIAVATAALLPAASSDSQATVLRSNAVVNPDSYSYAYETSNGIAAKEQGQLKQIGSESGIAAQGSYQYTAPDGTPVQIQYVADENGFQPQGAAIPTPPPLPAAIIRALEYLARNARPQ